MAFVEKSWVVDYSDSESITPSRWTQGFKRLTFSQTIMNDASTATHIFQTLWSDDKGPSKSEMLKEIAKVKAGMKIKFKIIPHDDSNAPVVQHNHVVYDWSDRFSNKGAIIVLRTAEPMMMATVTSKNLSRRASSIDQMVVDIMKDYSVTVTPEACAPVNDFQVLIQRNLTDMQFILQELVPRAANGSKGGYYLFTKDGINGFFQTLDYHVTDIFMPDAMAVLSVKDIEQSFDSARMGGSSHTVDGFDPFKKALLTYTATASSDTSGGSPMVTGSRYEYVPFQSNEAVKAWALERLGINAPTTAPLIVRLKGNTDVHIPMKLDLSQTSYRDNSNVVAPIAKIIHRVSKGVYTQTITLLKNSLAV